MMATVRGRGAKVIALRGKSSAASAAEAALDHVRDWFQGIQTQVMSVAMPAPKENPYNVPEGLVFSFPCLSKNQEWEIQNLPYGDYLKEEVEKTIKDLLDERKLALGY
jgi:malate dehydrogenase